MDLSQYFKPWIFQMVAMLLTVTLIPKLELTSVKGLLLIVIAISFVNAYLWDANLFFSMPETLTGRALQLLLVNGAIFWVLVKLLPGIETDGFFPCLLAPLVFTGCSVLAYHYGKSVNWSEVFSQTSTKVIDSSHQLRDHFNTSK